ncbi:hypothetical protein PR048_013938 [Dryococelus australis]|uniref:Uncharacterized protein n=1 Tax=Dryococelus australis TaxID=614101 RepID=A0ABQ9HTX9_9NEOP|nr:hypothetical protein PR048_013938 [Dryococelus australis]
MQCKANLNQVSELAFYSIVLDKNIDISVQLEIFVWVINDNFKTTEELLSLHPMKGTTQGTDLFQSLMEVPDKFNLELTNLAGIAIDGCPSMVGKNKGAIALVQKRKGDDALMLYHCIIH